MRSSIAIASLFAALTVAKPLRHIHHKKAVVTDLDIVVETDYITVTEGAVAAPTPKAPSTTVVIKDTHAPAPTAQAVKSPVQNQEAPAPVTTAPSKAAPSKAAASQAPSSDNSGLTPFQLAAVNAHNAHRSNHSVGTLQWNDTLAAAAANNAKKCVFKHDSAGQNLNMFGQKPFPSTIDLNSVVANSITEGWYNGELPTFHSYGVPNPVTPSTPGVAKPDDPWLHFTQVVWKDTASVGCAVQHCDAGTVNAYESVYTVCNYYPDGNFEGSFDKNVFKPGDDKTLDAKIVMS